MWDEIIYQFPNINVCTAEVKEWISNFIPHVRSMYLVTDAVCITVSETGNLVGDRHNKYIFHHFTPHDALTLVHALVRTCPLSGEWLTLSGADRIIK